jgi:RNA polymerase sigma-70 factor (ECF subfamily)
MTALPEPSAPAEERAAEATAASARAPTLAGVYREHFDLVWRSLRQLGVREPALEDVAHDVFLVVHRRLDDFDPDRGSMRAWLYGIARKVADRHRRGESRVRPDDGVTPESTPATTPERAVARAEAADLVQTFLDGLDADRREVFFMTEVEGMTAPEIAETLEIKLNTVYSRLRRARTQFADFVREQVGERQ